MRYQNCTNGYTIIFTHNLSVKKGGKKKKKRKRPSYFYLCKKNLPEFEITFFNQISCRHCWHSLFDNTFFLLVLLCLGDMLCKIFRLGVYLFRSKSKIEWKKTLAFNSNKLFWHLLLNKIIILPKECST